MAELGKVKFVTVIEVLAGMVGTCLVTVVVERSWPGWQILATPLAAIVLGGLTGLRCIRRLRRWQQSQTSLRMETLP